MRRTILGVLLVAVVFLAGCAQGSDTLAPPEIRYGETVCTQCNMIINDERFASALAYEVGPGRYETAVFDDIGDMLQYAAEHPEQPPVAWYVHDYESKEWGDATAATYVVTGQVATPMASGIVAFARADRADVMAYGLGLSTIDWETLRAQHAAGEIGSGAMREGHDSGGMGGMMSGNGN